MDPTYDQACRYAARLDGPGFLAWLLEGGELTFDRWLDTRTAALPGSGDRTGDLVASLHVNGVGPYWALPVEFQTTPDPEMTGRGLEMLGRLWREHRPPGGPGDRYQLGLAVINLTGNGRTSVDMKACGRRLATRLRVVERNLAVESARKTLAGIRAGTVSNIVLAWIPLMRGGDQASIIEEWQVLAQQEPNVRRRADLNALTLTLAEAANRAALWQPFLEGWTMNESKWLGDLLREMMAPKLAEVAQEKEVEGMAKGKASAILNLLSKRYPALATATITEHIRQERDLSVLDRWFNLLVEETPADILARELTS